MNKNSRTGFLKIVISFGIACVWSISGFAQSYGSPVPKPQIIPSNPQSQIFESYLNHAITEYNGLPEINIPLYTIQIKGVNIPITLSYHGEGIKYKQYDGDIGAGWSINAGGFRISRTIMGKPDDKYPFYSATFLASLAGDRPLTDAYLASIADYGSPVMNQSGDHTNRDGDYDYFTYSHPGANNQFIISNRTTKTVAYANANQEKIILDEGISTMPLDNLKVIDNQGISYLYGGLQSGVALVEKTWVEDFKTSWPLRKIETPFNGSVDFTYDLMTVNMNPETNYRYSILDAEIMQSINAWPPTGEPVKYYSVSDPEEITSVVERIQFIKKIETENEKVEFFRLQSSHVLGEIRITDLKSNVQRSIYFNYGYSVGHRLLTSISSEGKTHNFEYYDAPADMAQAYPDQWGFYKYSFTGSNYWDLFLHEEFKDYEFFKNFIPAAPYITTTASVDDELPYLYPQWLDRKTNDNPHYFSLRRIIYPTGGSTEYVYEPNQYRESPVNDPNLPLINGAGQRIKEIISKPSSTEPGISTRFKYGDNEDGSGVINYDLTYDMKNRFYSETYYVTVFDAPVVASYYRLQAVRTFSTKPTEMDMRHSNPVSYSRVNVYQYDLQSGQNNGRTESLYDIPVKFLQFPYGHPNLSFAPPRNDYHNLTFAGALLGEQATLNERKIFDKTGNPVQKEVFNYIPIGTPNFSGVKARQKVFCNSYSSGSYANYSATDFYMESVSTLTSLHAKLISNKTTTQYSQTGGTPLVTTENYEYNALHQLVKQTKSNSTGSFLSNEFQYPESASTGIYATMFTKNIIAPSIKQYLKKNTSELQVTKNNYTDNVAISNGLIVPLNVQNSFSGELNLVTRLSYDKYDTKGNIVQFTGSDGLITSYVWDYNFRFPIAEVLNASHSDIAATSFESDGKGNWTFSGLPVVESTSVTGAKSYNLANGAVAKTSLNNTKNYVLTYWKKDNSGTALVNGGAGNIVVQKNGWTLFSHNLGSTTSITLSGTGLVDELRLYPKGATMTTNCYTPGIGKTSQTDVNNKTTYFEFDSKKRLSIVRDEDRNILKKYCYNYFGQPEDCTSPCVDNNPSWVNTGNLRCQLNSSCGYTGYQEIEQENINLCSSNPGAKRWILGNYVPGTCATSSYVQLSVVNNAGATGLSVKYTSTLNPSEYYIFPIPSTSGPIGCLPTVKTKPWDIHIYHNGIPMLLSYTIAGTTVSGTPADFNNYVINPFTRVITIDLDLEP